MKRKRTYIDQETVSFALRAAANSLELDRETDGYTVEQTLARVVRFLYAVTDLDPEEFSGDAIADIDAGMDDIFDDNEED